jgi:hypothetical protein
MTRLLEKVITTRKDIFQNERPPAAILRTGILLTIESTLNPIPREVSLKMSFLELIPREVSLKMSFLKL